MINLLAYEAVIENKSVLYIQQKQNKQTKPQEI